MAPSIGADFVRWSPPDGGDKTLGILDFPIFPHLDYEGMPDNSMANAERWAAKVTDGAVEVISEGHWKLFTPKHREHSHSAAAALT